MAINSLMKHKAGPKERALLSALINGDLDQAQAIFGDGDINLDAEVQPGTPLLKRFVVLGDMEAVTWLLEHGAKPDARMYCLSPMFFAARENELGICEKLLAANADINRPGPNGMSPIYAAANCGHMELFQWFLDHRADTSMVDKLGRDAFEVAGRKMGYDSEKISAMRHAALTNAIRRAEEAQVNESVQALSEDEVAMRDYVKTRTTRRL